MTDRRKRLANLLVVQEKLKAFHEARHAGYLAEAAAAEKDAAEIAARLDDPSSLSSLFPDVYHRRIGQAIAHRDANAGKATAEATKVAMATARTNMVERAYREVMRREEREAGDRERLEIVERRPSKPAAS